MGVGEMAAGFKSYTTAGVLSIDSSFSGFSYVKTETLTGYGYLPSWRVTCASDEVLVITGSSTAVGVLPRGVNEWVVFSFLPNSLGSSAPNHAALITLDRYSSRPLLAKGLFTVYTEDGRIAFTSGQKMLRPYGYAPPWRSDVQQALANYRRQNNGATFTAARWSQNLSDAVWAPGYSWIPPLGQPLGIILSPTPRDLYINPWSRTYIAAFQGYEVKKDIIYCRAGFYYIPWEGLGDVTPPLSLDMDNYVTNPYESLLVYL